MENGAADIAASIQDLIKRLRISRMKIVWQAQKLGKFLLFF